MIYIYIINIHIHIYIYEIYEINNIYIYIYIIYWSTGESCTCEVLLWSCHFKEILYTDI